MVRLSEKTRLALKADISSILYENPLKAMFTKEIGLVERIVKNMKGKKYEKRVKWRIPQNMLKFYKEIS